ncbi:MAG TPA: carbon-nitrogen hydrolase family protein [Modicisalibacter sp.]|nr:carbon-nitrogen hydrolase family protein [Modicisalibacter sp.]
MQQDITVSVIQHTPGDMQQRQENVNYIVSQLELQAQAGSRLIVFPEVGITSFFRHEPGGVKTYWEQGTISLDGEELQRIIKAAHEFDVYTVVGFAERTATTGMIYNSAALIGPDGIVGIARKLHMPGLEKLYYSPGDGVEVFECELGRIGIAICYDAMFPEYFKALSEQGVDIIVLSSSIWRGGKKGGVGLEGVKRDYWKALPMVTAIQNQAFVVACNACGELDMGSQAGVWERLGLSQIVAPTGVVLACAGEIDEETIRATLTLHDLVEARTSYRFLNDRLL